MRMRYETNDVPKSTEMFRNLPIWEAKWPLWSGGLQAGFQQAIGIGVVLAIDGGGQEVVRVIGEGRKSWGNLGAQRNKIVWIDAW